MKRNGTKSKNKEEAAPRSYRIAEVADFARLDIGRAERCGTAEVVYGEGKSIAQLRGICKHFVAEHGGVLVSRLAEKSGRILQKEFGGSYNSESSIFCVLPEKIQKIPGKVALVCAGTCDLPVALEAKAMLDFSGVDSEVIADVGIACIERIYREAERLSSAGVVLVFAGMEGALPAVVASLISKPVIAIPCSVGYGVSAGGFAALNSMLASCVGGVTVVNIDNGIGAAAAAVRILKNGLQGEQNE